MADPNVTPGANPAPGVGAVPKPAVLKTGFTMKTGMYFALFFGLVVGIPAAGVLPNTLPLRWISTAIVLLAILLVYANAETGTILGAFVDSRQKTSSSKVQVFAWTVLILSAFSAAAFWNITQNFGEPLSIAIPPAIWAVMGISVASFVGSPVVKNSKQNKGEVLPRNVAATQASFTDIMKGEEDGSTETLDFSKIQMLLFTLIILIAYGGAIYEMMVSAAQQGQPIRAFPSVDDGMVALMGISHSGYLVYKSVPKTTGGPGNGGGGGQ